MHTPGPWRVEIRRTASMPWWHINTATVHGEITVNTSEDDARLIAAAPELLEALQLAVNLLSDYSGDEASDIPSLLAVIAKAEGRGE